MWRAVVVLVVTVVLAGCGEREKLVAARAPGVGPDARFRPPSLGRAAARGRAIKGMRCSRGPRARFAAHLELFAAGKVVLVAPGIGIAPPRERTGAYVGKGRCEYPLRTREPTGLIEVEQGARATLGDLFAIWGQPLSRHRMAGFRGAVRAYVGGRRVREDPRRIPLTPHAQIVLQVGPYVKPHSRYLFPPGL